MDPIPFKEKNPIEIKFSKAAMEESKQMCLNSASETYIKALEVQAKQEDNFASSIV